MRFVCVLLLCANAYGLEPWELEFGKNPTEGQWARVEQLIVVYAKEHGLKIQKPPAHPDIIWNPCQGAIIVNDNGEFAFMVAGYNAERNAMIIFAGAEPKDWLHEVGHAYGLDREDNVKAHKHCEHFVDYCTRKWKTDKGKPKGAKEQNGE